MTERNDGRFEGMVLAKLASLEERVDEVLRFVREIQARCLREQTAHASLATEMQALREKTNFLTRVIWSAIAWIVLAAAGLILAAVKFNL